ncbi:mitochondrial fission ELM1 family protein [Elioraea rosea]|uniref:mitochondrial fission ELM1 family protein n=1 Tax=Elioraea rosea TaxID=2492390 RepID=UPI0011839847|nr:mitochondrial fission ELM1 family protein [Elioraea rosea]
MSPRATNATATEAATPPVWVLADPRAGTAAQALGIAEALGEPFVIKPLAWTGLSRLPNLLPGGSLIGLAAEARARLVPPWPRLVIAAGRRAAPVALWLKRRSGARLVQVMRPGVAPSRFDLLVLPVHDRPQAAPNVIEVVGAPHRITRVGLEEAAASWAQRVAHLPRPRVALLVGGPVRAEGLEPALARDLATRVAALAVEAGGSVLATTSRRTGRPAEGALAEGLDAVPHLLHRWAVGGENPYRGFLGLADVIVVTGDSVSMLSEACATRAPVFFWSLPGLAGPRHARFHASLVAAGLAAPLGATLEGEERAPLDEARRVAEAIRARGLI